MYTTDKNLSPREHRLLLVEDNYDDAELLTDQLLLLKNNGFHFEHVDTLAKGISKLADGNFDVVLLDLTLPDSVGLETLVKVHNTAPTSSVIVLTGNDDDSMAVQALRYGAQDYLVKGSIDLSGLCRSISYAMARQEASELTNRMAAIVESLADSIIGKTLQGTITTWNRGSEKLYGYTDHEAIGQSVEMLFPPGADGELAQILESIKRGVTISDKETVRVKKNGEKVDVSITVSPIKQPDGTVTGAASIAHDISERKKSDSQKKELEQRLSLALKAGDIGVWDFDLVDGTGWRSHRHDEIFGIEDFTVKWGFQDFIDQVLPADRENVSDAFKDALHSGRYDIECRILRRDQTEHWISAKGEFVQDHQGIPIRMMGTISDITERKKQDEQRRLLAIMEEREDFMATLTHDMKNPLIGAKRLLELFVTERLGALSDEQKGLLHTLTNSVSDVLKLINDQIEVYRWEKNAYSSTLVDTNLSHLISTCVLHRTPIAQLRGIEIIAVLPENSPMIQIDATAVQRVISNLVDNAVKFSKDNSQVHVRLSLSEKQAIIEVEDQGYGISVSDHDHLFERFSQGSAGKRCAGGSGLGLYLCKQIVEAHSGTITCISESGLTTFRVYLPAVTHNFSEGAIGETNAR